MVEDGRKTVAALDAAGLEITAALWLLDAEADEWRLILETPLVESVGPIAVYTRIREVIGRTGTLQSIGPTDIQVRSPADPFLKLLRSAVRTGPGLSAIRFKRNVINGTFIEDALIYRLT